MCPLGWQTIARTAGAGLTAQPSARTSIRLRMFVAGPELSLKGSPTGPSRFLLRRAAGDEVQHALRRLGAGDLDQGQLLRREPRQHVIGDLVLVGRPADSDLHAAKLVGLERLDDRAHAVVAAVSAPHAHAHRAKGEIDVVVHENAVRGPEPEPAGKPGYRRPDHVHEG